VTKEQIHAQILELAEDANTLETPIDDKKDLRECGLDSIDLIGILFHLSRLFPNIIIPENTFMATLTIHAFTELMYTLLQNEAA